MFVSGKVPSAFIPCWFKAERERFIVDCRGVQNGSENKHVVLFQTWEIGKRNSRNAQRS